MSESSDQLLADGVRRLAPPIETADASELRAEFEEQTGMTPAEWKRRWNRDELEDSAENMRLAVRALALCAEEVRALSTPHRRPIVGARATWLRRWGTYRGDWMDGEVLMVSADCAYLLVRTGDGLLYRVPVQLGHERNGRPNHLKLADATSADE